MSDFDLVRDALERRRRYLLKLLTMPGLDDDARAEVEANVARVGSALAAELGAIKGAPSWLNDEVAAQDSMLSAYKSWRGAAEAQAELDRFRAIDARLVPTWRDISGRRARNRWDNTLHGPNRSGAY